MRTYLLIGYVIIALQCLHISASANAQSSTYLKEIQDLGSGDGDELSGSGWKASETGDYDAEEDDDYYGYDDDDEGSGMPDHHKPVPEIDLPYPAYPPEKEDSDFEIESETGQFEIPAQPDYELPPSPAEIPPVKKPSTTEPSAPLPTNNHKDMDSNIRIMSQNDDDRTVSIFAQPGILAAFIGGAVMGLLIAILLVMFIVYRMRKRDEGSYPLDEPKRVPLTSSYAPNDKEIYA